jgi:hypothetical protein
MINVSLTRKKCDFILNRKRKIKAILKDYLDKKK